MKHQFYTKDFFIPSWDIKYLFLGTFNPNEGEKVNYFYTRKTNLLWPTLSKIFNDELNAEKLDFFEVYVCFVQFFFQLLFRQHFRLYFIIGDNFLITYDVELVSVCLHYAANLISLR